MPTKLIRAYRSPSYGPPLVTDKYAPLRDIDFSEADADFCDGLLNRRWQLLHGFGLLPQPLALVMPDWAKAIAAEAGKKSPLVVISTNRSKWIKSGIEAGNVQLGGLDITQFDNASDLRALTARSRQKLSPPMYCPSRIGEAAGPRNVYVVVHTAEYQTYKRNLAVEPRITVVGWQFKPPREGAVPLCGFGASRFAAIEFCKHLRTAAGEPWDYAWLFDDNVVAFTSFAGYGKVEAVMDAAKKEKPTPKPYICAGFNGGTVTISPKDNAKWATDELAGGERDEIRGKQYAELPVTSPTGGLIQQAALWNIAELTKKKLNFGPIFVTSGEDVSLGNYFDAKKIPYLFYDRIGIRKEDTENDDGKPAAVVKQGREELIALIAEMERSEASAFLQPPPPIMIKPLIKPPPERVRDDAEQTLARFIENSVLPNASEVVKAQAAGAVMKNTASCQAAEQTICKAIKLGHVRDAALNQTFRINGDEAQTVVQADRQ
jgi:hypothetical protein